MMSLRLMLLALFFGLSALTAQNAHDFSTSQMLWVDEQMKKMSFEDKLGQLFMVAAYSNKGDEHQKQIEYLIKNYKIGGLIFFQGDPISQARLTNTYQELSRTPLLIAIDAEWGLSMRLKKTPKYPRQLMLGAIRNNELIYEMGKDIARQCKRLGIHLNLAPVADVNNNPNNPVINDRSFGEEPHNVAAKSVAYMDGMEKNGILACAKHFPGHGDTDKDSHHTLPVIKHSRARLEQIELYPFKELIRKEVGTIMSAHLAIPSLDNRSITDQLSSDSPSMPASLSKPIITGLLKGELEYDGLVLTDALNMKGVSNYFPPGEVDVKALLAGNDILLYPENVGAAIDAIKKSVELGEISASEIESRVRKILKAKFRVGLSKQNEVETENLLEDLNTPATSLLIRQLTENAITVVKNENDLLPFKNLSSHQFASVAFGSTSITPFQSTLDKYAGFAHFNLPKGLDLNQLNKNVTELKNFSTVVVALHNMSRRSAKKFGISAAQIELVKQLASHTRVVLVVFGNPYALKYFEGLENVVVSYNDYSLTQDITAQILFGAIAANGRLPVSAGGYSAGEGVETEGKLRLKHTIPEENGLNDADFFMIDSIANEAIADKATPGCQVLVAHRGNVVFHKAYGYHTYDSLRAVQLTDLYDVASITKIAASTLGVMQMVEQSRLSLEDSLTLYFTNLVDTSDKRNLTIKDILHHHSGLKDWIPFYLKTLPENGRLNEVYSRTENSRHQLKVADGMFLRNDYQDTIWHRILSSPLYEEIKYKYSDLGFYFLKKILEDLSFKPFEQYVSEEFYRPMGLNKTAFNPLQKFEKNSIIPTENDTKYRKQLLRGYVHDMGAAMLGGVGGHAGLFSNANDLAKLMQMFLNRGTYGGERFLKDSTIQHFTSRHRDDNRRGLGFDKPEFRPELGSPTADCVSPATFGHTGFTGTCAWVDPKHELVYIFLSNRIHPTMNNRLLVKNNIRTRIQEVIYEAIGVKERSPEKDEQ